MALTIGMDLVMLALVAYAAHARLAAERPPTEHLTGFYLVVATGGALGGLLNGLVAPMVFDRVLEYSLALMVVPLLLVGIRGGRDSWLARQVDANRVRAIAVCLVVVLLPLALRLALNASGADLVQTVPLIVLALVVVGGWRARRRRWPPPSPCCSCWARSVRPKACWSGAAPSSAATRWSTETGERAGARYDDARDPVPGTFPAGHTHHLLLARRSSG